jgi:hypothetical protein
VSQANYRVRITEHDYYYTTYTAWVSATSRNQAIIKAAALAGQEKYRREAERTGREPGVEGLIEPEIKIEPMGLNEFDEFWDKRDTVEVTQ